jgi:YVTN family beta-propeller protein
MEIRMRIPSLSNSGVLSLMFAAAVASAPLAAQPFAYVTDIVNNKVWVIDTSTNTVLPTPITVGAGPAFVALNPAGTLAFVTNQNDNTVSVIDTATNTVTATVPVGKYPEGVVVSSDGSLAYVANFHDSSISVIDTSSGTVTTTIPIKAASFAAEPNQILVEAETLFVTDSANGRVLEINQLPSVRQFAIPAGPFPIGIAISPQGYLYVVNPGDGSVSVLATTTISVGNSSSLATSIAISPDGKYAYVTDQGSNTVSVIDTSTNTVIMSLATGMAPIEPAITADGANVLVTDFLGGAVSVIATSSNTTVAPITLPAGSFPFGIAVQQPASQILTALINAINGMKLGNWGNSLTAKLKQPPNCNEVDLAFQNEVSAQSGKKLTPKEVYVLSSLATNISFALQCFRQ